GILRDWRDLAVHLHRRRQTRRDKQVRRLLVRHQFEETGEIDAAHAEAPGFGIRDSGFAEAGGRGLLLLRIPNPKSLVPAFISRRDACPWHSHAPAAWRPGHV